MLKLSPSLWVPLTQFSGSSPLPPFPSHSFLSELKLYRLQATKPSHHSSFLHWHQPKRPEIIFFSWREEKMQEPNQLSPGYINFPQTPGSPEMWILTNSSGITERASLEKLTRLLTHNDHCLWHPLSDLYSSTPGSWKGVDMPSLVNKGEVLSSLVIELACIWKPSGGVRSIAGEENLSLPYWHIEDLIGGTDS